MTRINCMIVGLSLVSCSLGAMGDKSQPLSRSQELKIWQHNNMRALGIERQRNMKELKNEYQYNLKALEFEQKRLVHAQFMDRETYLQRYGTPEEYFSYTRGVQL